MGTIRTPGMATTGVATLRRAVHSFICPGAVSVRVEFYRHTNFSFFSPLKKSSGSLWKQQQWLRVQDAISFTRPTCKLAGAAKSDPGILAKRVGDKGTTDDIKRVVEMVNRASSRREVVHTDFLTPPVLKDSLLLLENLVDVKMVAQGGYPEAERCRLSVGHPEALTTDPDIVGALSISGNFSFQPCSHGDFLGAILGTGISRDKVGDIILQGERGAQVLVVPELVDYLTSSLDKVGNVTVTCKTIPLLALEYELPRTKSMKTVEASLRLDSIASAGFKISRSKMAGLISGGNVRVNWTTILKSNTTVKTGDIISVSGKGRCKVGEINTTRKGKFAVELIRCI